MMNVDRIEDGGLSGYKEKGRQKRRRKLETRSEYN